MDNIFFDLKQIKYLGEDSIIGKTVRIRRPEEVTIGDHTIIDDFTYISTALKIGAYSHIASNVVISGGSSAKVVIGNFTGISTGVSIHAATSEYISVSFDLPSIPESSQIGGICKDIVINDHVLIGTKSTIMPGVFLPEGFASSAYSFIPVGDYEPWTLYGGNPIKKIHRRKNNNKIKKEIEKLLRLNNKHEC